MSAIIQRGDKNIMIAIKKPNGFILNASMNLPFVNDKIERVEPQDGQGIFVKCLTKHTSIGLPTEYSCDKPK
jgi:hypothetical protein